MQKKGFMMNKMNKLGRERGNSFTNYSDDEDDMFESASANFDKEFSIECGATMAKSSKSSKKRSVFETKSKKMSKASASKW